jgi:hypothetical protein
MPQNVDDEGLERHTYTTAWAPRGSFDNPKVGHAGYAVPDYVKEEGYGVGAMTTRWAPRGTYFGPKIKHWLDRPSARVVGRQKLPGGATQVKIETMAGVETAATGAQPFSAYGQRVARGLLASVAPLPDSVRKKMLKAAMDRIDPTLYSRSEAAAQPELHAGVPPQLALERGIAYAVSHGFARELVDLGKGKKLARRSQLGAVMTLGGAAAFAQKTMAIPTVGTPTGPMLQVGPFFFPIAVKEVRYHTLSAEQSAFVTDNMKIALTSALRSGNALTGSGYLSALSFANGTYPFAKFTFPNDPSNPNSGKHFGLYKNGELISFKEQPPPGQGLFDAIWNGIQWVASAIVGVVKDVVNWVGDQTCKLMNSDLGKVGAAAAGAVVGGPAGAQAGVMGAQIAANACAATPPTCAAGQMIGPDGKTCVPIPAPPPSTSSKMLPILLIGGAGVAALLLLGKKK